MRTPAPGERVGPYVVEGELGRGGMGAVVRARHVETGAVHALKLLLPGALSSWGDSQRVRFAREAEALAALDHPGIVRIHAADLEGPRPYFAQALLAGPSLAERLRAGPLPPAEAIAATVRLADALAHAHARGLLHRDLKPANVLQGEGGRPVLVDFGLARSADAQALTRTGEILGSPHYMAPEQADGRAHQADERTDVYGLAATCYAMLAGGPPFSGGTAFEVLQRVLLAAPTPLPAGLVPPAVEELLGQALAKDRAQRPPDVTSFARALEAAWAAPAARRSRPLARGLVAAAVALAVAGLIGIAWGPGPDALPEAEFPPAPATPTLDWRSAARAALERGDVAAARSALAQAPAEAPERAHLALLADLIDPTVTGEPPRDAPAAVAAAWRVERARRELGSAMLRPAAATQFASLAARRNLSEMVEGAGLRGEPALEPVRTVLRARWRDTMARVALHQDDVALAAHRQHSLAFIAGARDLLGEAHALTLAEVGVRTAPRDLRKRSADERAELLERVAGARTSAADPAGDGMWRAYARALELAIAPEKHRPFRAEDLLAPTYEVERLPLQAAAALELVHQMAFNQALTEAWRGAQRRGDHAGTARAARLAEAHALELAALAPRCSRRTAARPWTCEGAALTAALLRRDLEAARERLARATESERLGPLPLAVFAVEVALLAGDVPGASAHLGAAKRALEAAAKPNPADVALVSYLEAALLLERGDREGADAAGVTGAGQARQSWLPWRSAHEVERALRGEPDPRVWLASGR